MIELLEGFPDNVAAFALHAHVTKADYDGVMIPDFEDRLSRHKKLRIYVEIATDLEGFDPGAVWEDQKFGWKHFFDWERCALVTDVAWAKHAAKFSEFFGFLWPGEYRTFSEAEADKARDWIADDKE
jgi:SpoIIAA-like